MRIASELLFSEGRWKVERAVKERKTGVNLTPQGPGWLKCGHEGVFTQHITCGILLQFETNRCGDSRDLLDFNFCLLSRLHLRTYCCVLLIHPVLQVVAYGVGGQYEPHRDYFGSGLLGSSPKAESGGDRIATLLYYLSDVQEGGATVFPSLGLAVHPQRGSALFWYNVSKDD